MLRRLARLLRLATGHRYLEVAESTSARVVIKSGMTTSVFDKSNDSIIQNGTKVGLVSSIHEVAISQPYGQEGPANWYVTVVTPFNRQILVGSATDEVEASLAAAKIASLSGRPVKV